MSYIQLHNTKRLVPGVGPRDAKIAIVGEAPGAQEEIALRPFVGPAGSVLEQCLHAAGLIRSEVYMTNVVKERPRGNDIEPFYSTKRRVFTELGLPYVQQLQEELAALNPNVIVACGATALAALTGLSRVMTYRGYWTLTRGLPRDIKVMPCIHPSAALRGMYIYRHLITMDLKKAKEGADTPDLVLPQRQLVLEYGSVGEALEWLDYFAAQPRVAFDIEVLNYELACISFSSEPNIAASIPVAKAWTELDELQIWRGIQRVLSNPNSVKVGQNLVFDIQFLLSRCGLVVRGPIEDTMIAHHIMYPDLQKGLGFLVSVYGGTQPYYKDMVKFDDIKENS